MNELGAVCPPVVFLSAIGEGGTPYPNHMPFLAQACQRLWLVGSHDVYRQFTCVHHIIRILVPDHLDTGSRNVPSRFHCRRTDEAPLSQELSHRLITQAARLGRIPVAEHRVMS